MSKNLTDTLIPTMKDKTTIKDSGWINLPLVGSVQPVTNDVPRYRKVKLPGGGGDCLFGWHSRKYHSCKSAYRIATRGLSSSHARTILVPHWVCYTLYPAFLSFRDISKWIYKLCYSNSARQNRLIRYILFLFRRLATRQGGYRG